MEIVPLPAKHSFSAAQPPSFASIPAFMPVLAGHMSFTHTLPPARFLGAGSLLVEQACFGRAIHLVTRGIVKLVHQSTCGRETAIGLRSEGWYAGSTSALLNAPSVYSVRALTDCMIVRIPARDFPRHLKESPDMMDHFLWGLCFEVASQSNLQAELLEGCGEERPDRLKREREAFHPKAQAGELPMRNQMDVEQLLLKAPEPPDHLLHKRTQAASSTTARPRHASRKRLPLSSRTPFRLP